MRQQRARVLIEHANSCRRRRQALDLETAGFEVETCAGSRTPPGRPCPVVTCGRCAVATVDVIINELPLGQLGVYAVQDACVDDSAVDAQLFDIDTNRYPIVTNLPRVLPRNAAATKLVDAVHQALTESSERS